MIKLLDLLKEDSPFVPRGGKERIEAYSLEKKAEAENKIQQYVKNGMKGDLYLSDAPITSLPSSLTRVEGDLDLYNTSITLLPPNLTKVGGDLNLNFTPLISLPYNLTVEGDLYLSATSINSLPYNLKVGGTLSLLNTPLSKKYSKDEIKVMIPNVKGKIYM